MKPVDQTIFGGRNGNCLAACLASILEVPIADVPNFCAEHPIDWIEVAGEWLKQFDLWLLNVQFRNPAPKILGYHLMGGPSSRDCEHSVVGLDGKMVFDPHLSRAGLLEVKDYGLLVKRHREVIER